MTENLSTLVSSELCRNCVKRKGLCRQHQHRGDGENNVGDDDNEGNTVQRRCRITRERRGRERSHRHCHEQMKSPRMSLSRVISNDR